MAFRKEQIGDCTLYLGDCMDILPTLGKVDGLAIVTDPPFGLGKIMQGGGWAFRKFDEFVKWDIAPPSEFIRELCNVPSIVWGGNYFELPVARCWLIWDKQNAVPTMADVEMAWTNLDKPAKRLSLPCGRNEYGHPTQKPVSLMRWCLSFLPDAQTILDPFMGSGTTLVACAKMGRKGIGIELDEDYFEIACRRVEQAYAQPDLFIEPPAKQVQHGLDL